MGASASIPVETVDLSLFKKICGEDFHKEVFDAYKDENDLIIKNKMFELVEFVERFPRFEEVFLFFGLDNNFYHFTL